MHAGPDPILVAAGCRGRGPYPRLACVHQSVILLCIELMIPSGVHRFVPIRAESMYSLAAAWSPTLKSTHTDVTFSPFYHY